MKSLSVYKIIPYFIFIIAFIACTSDTYKNDDASVLVGVWQRTDVSEIFEYQLVFLENNLGYKTVREGNSDLATSSAVTFNWSLKNKQLTLTFPEIITTSYSFNEVGQLLLNDLTTFPFNKLVK